MTKCLKKINERCFKVENDKDKLWNETKKVKEIKKINPNCHEENSRKEFKGKFLLSFLQECV